MQGLNRIFRKFSHLPVLRALYYARAPMTGREVERRTGLSNRATMMALQSLCDACCVHCEETAHAHWYQLNTENYLVKRVLLQAFEAEEQFWEDLRKTTRRLIKPRPRAAVATGPLARDESLSEGRLELTLLFDSGRSRVRAYNSMPDLEALVNDRYALPLKLTLLDMNNMDKEEFDDLWKRVAREGILLFGTLP